MPFIHFPARRRPAFGLLALALTAVALVVATNTSQAAPAGKHAGEQRFVVRDDATVIDGPCDASRIVLGAGTANRLVIGVSGDSCQDGAGPLETASFTGLGHFYVKRGTGSYAGATGTGLAHFAEDAANNHRMTLIGRLAR